MGGFLVLEMKEAKKTDFPKKLDVLIGQVTNRIHYPDQKVHYSQTVGHEVLCTLQCTSG